LQADVLIASNNFLPAYWTVLLGRLTRRPSVIWVHGPISNVLEKAHASNRKKAWLRWIYKRADLLVCASETSRQSLLRFMGQTSLNTTVIHNPCIAPASSSSKPIADQTNDICPNNKRLGFVGRLSSEKQPLQLLQLLRCLPESYQLDIIGDGPLMPEIRRQGSDLIADGRLKLLGALQATAAHYQSWQATILCSEYEGYPMTALESLACGTPCVATPIPALQEMLAVHAPYMLASNHSPQALAKAIEKTLAMPSHQLKKDTQIIVSLHTPEKYGSLWANGLSLLISAKESLAH
jgi:glycosyltransferase involved in cell wall biosynthesis